MKTKVLVCGGAGFIGHHLARFLKKKGYWVRLVDINKPEFFSEKEFDEFLQLDLREKSNCEKAVKGIDHVYQLAADMGGMGFIHSAECEIMHNNVLINVNMIDSAVKAKVKRYFFSSSVCVYRDMKHGEKELTEEGAYPAFPDNEYGWEKLYSERIALTYSRKYPIQVRIARFNNCYGPEGTWKGGREKAPAALSRKVAEVNKDGIIDIWGDGTAVRAFVYVDDLVEAVYKLMHSGIKVPVNIGTKEYVSVNELLDIICKVAKKKVRVMNIAGPVGVESRNFSNDKIESLGWEPKYNLLQGIEKTYPWIKKQVEDNK